jgi:hypothetical protein
MISSSTLSLLIAAFAFVSPALAEDAKTPTTESAPAPSGDIAQKKDDAKKQMTQETVALGGGRFLLIDGGPGVYENVYGFDIIKVVDGIPRREPLFMQEFDAESRAMGLADAVAISAMNYNFDKKDNILSYTSRSADGNMRYRYQYTLANDMFVLDEVIGQEYCADSSCKSKPPQTIFKSKVAAAPVPTPAAAAPAAGMPEKQETAKAAEKMAAAVSAEKKEEVKPVEKPAMATTPEKKEEAKPAAEKTADKPAEAKPEPEKTTAPADAKKN